MNNKQAGEKLKALIMKRLKENKRTIAWLAEALGMNYYTLRGQIKDRPHKLSVFTLLATEKALNLPAGDLLFPYFSAPLAA